MLSRLARRRAPPQPVVGPEVCDETLPDPDLLDFSTCYEGHPEAVRLAATAPVVAEQAEAGQQLPTAAPCWPAGTALSPRWQQGPDGATPTQPDVRVYGDTGEVQGPEGGVGKRERVPWDVCPPRAGSQLRCGAAGLSVPPAAPVLTRADGAAHCSTPSLVTGEPAVRWLSLPQASSGSSGPARVNAEAGLSAQRSPHAGLPKRPAAVPDARGTVAWAAPTGVGIEQGLCPTKPAPAATGPPVARLGFEVVPVDALQPLVVVVGEGADTQAAPAAAVRSSPLGDADDSDICSGAEDAVAEEGCRRAGSRVGLFEPETGGRAAVKAPLALVVNPPPQSLSAALKMSAVLRCAGKVRHGFLGAGPAPSAAKAMPTAATAAATTACAAPAAAAATTAFADGAGAAVTARGTVWACVACTYENSSVQPWCEMCGEGRPGGRASRHSPRPCPPLAFGVSTPHLACGGSGDGVRSSRSGTFAGQGPGSSGRGMAAVGCRPHVDQGVVKTPAPSGPAGAAGPRAELSLEGPRVRVGSERMVILGAGHAAVGNNSHRDGAEEDDAACGEAPARRGVPTASALAGPDRGRLAGTVGPGPAAFRASTSDAACSVEEVHPDRVVSPGDPARDGSARGVPADQGVPVSGPSPAVVAVVPFPALVESPAPGWRGRSGGGSTVPATPDVIELSGSSDDGCVAVRPVGRAAPRHRAGRGGGAGIGGDVGGGVGGHDAAGDAASLSSLPSLSPSSATSPSRSQSGSPVRPLGYHSRKLASRVAGGAVRVKGSVGKPCVAGSGSIHAGRGGAGGRDFSSSGVSDDSDARDFHVASGGGSGGGSSGTGRHRALEQRGHLSVPHGRPPASSTAGAAAVYVVGDEESGGESDGDRNSSSFGDVFEDSCDDGANEGEDEGVGSEWEDPILFDSEPGDDDPEGGRWAAQSRGEHPQLV
jgi:hypothetical protein